MFIVICATIFFILYRSSDDLPNCLYDIVFFCVCILRVRPPAKKADFILHFFKKGEHTMKVSLFGTCLVDMMKADIGIATVELLEHLGCEVDYPEGQICCG